MAYTLPQAETYIDQAFTLPIAVLIYSPLQVGILDSSSGYILYQGASAGAALLPGTTICPGQCMSAYEIIHQQPGDSAASAMPQGAGTAWLSQHLPGHPPPGGPLHTAAQSMAMGMQPPVYAMRAEPERPMEWISAEMKPQAMMDFPEANVFDWLNENGGMLAPQGSGLDGENIVIIGGGQTGLFMAIHLAQAGGNVYVLEASNTSQGRAETHVFSDGSKAPLGMMRYGLGQAIFGHLVQELGYVMTPHFPDPGVVPTLIHYEGESLEWNDNKTAPGGFEKVQYHFNRFIHNGWGGLEGWEKIRTCLQNDEPERARQATQAWIDRFRNATFDSAIREIFSDVWGEEELNRFDTIGVGSGGFRVLKHVSLFAIMRIIVNGFEDHQCSLGKWNGQGVEAAGPDDIIEALRRYAIDKGVQLCMNTPVSSVTHDGQSHIIQTSTGVVMDADIVVCTTTLPAMVRIQGLPELLGSVFSGDENLPADCRSGKLFTLNDVSGIPEMNEPDFPRVLLSDLRNPQTYLTPGKTPNTCVLLMWYGWQKAYDDFAHMSDPELIKECSEIAKEIVKGTKYERSWNMILDNVLEYTSIRWQDHSFAGSAFNIAEPKGNQKLREASFLWGSGGRITNRKVFAALADLQGAGGWNEGGYVKGSVDLSAILKRFGTVYSADLAPCNLLKKETLVYNDF